MQNNKQRIQRSCWIAVFAISLHLMMKHQGILCNKKLLRFIAAVVCLMIPEGNSALYSAVPQDVTEQRPAPGQQNNMWLDGV